MKGNRRRPWVRQKARRSHPQRSQGGADMNFNGTCKSIHLAADAWPFVARVNVAGRHLGIIPRPGPCHGWQDHSKQWQ
eukprot:5271629-Karenia_brevis.AAC.1